MNTRPASEMRSPDDWNERYKSGDMPWDSGRPSQELVNVIESGIIRPCRTMDLGCGAGTNAIYLAGLGFQVTAIDISEVAIDMARQRAQTAGVRVDFLTTDLTVLPAGRSFDFVFDRGCYHCVRGGVLANYVNALDHLTHPGAKFLLLAGNANEPHEEGPPTVHEHEIRAELGALFDFDWIRPFRFETNQQAESPLGWSVLMTRRDA